MDMVDAWLLLREVERQALRKAHPDLIDRLGRTWEWIDGDLYRRHLSPEERERLGYATTAWPIQLIPR